MRRRQLSVFSQVTRRMRRIYNRLPFWLVWEFALVLALSISLNHDIAYADEEFAILQKKNLGEGIGQPGAVHLSLNPLIGKWNMDISVWNAPNDQTPQRLSGTMQRRWILKGRFWQVLADLFGQRNLESGSFYHNRSIWCG